ncbi:MAG: hypothetical protein NT178_04145 [Proteobacteria bacterium]|nr:hypothetical protein [Pseudomonadota bacterium]
MKNVCKEYFLSLNTIFSEVVALSFDSKHESLLSSLFQFVEDLTLWQSMLEFRTDTTILVSAIKEYQLGFQAAVCGQYRYAFTAHRYFIEQMCRFIYLSTNELYLRHWKLGLRDVSWGVITDKENGIFSKNFIRAFYPEIDDEGAHVLAIVSKLYRESSEFVHGNFDKIRIIPSQIEFNLEMLSKWLEFMETSKFVALFLLFMRFAKDIDGVNIHKLEDMARDELCGIEGFNLLFL